MAEVRKRKKFGKARIEKRFEGKIKRQKVCEEEKEAKRQKTQKHFLDEPLNLAP